VPAPGGSAAAPGSLSDRLRHLDIGTSVDYTPKRVALGDAQGVLDAAVSAYEARLAPPPDILARTFGYIYERRSGTHPDSLAYVYNTYTIGPLRMCKAWKIIEHPYRAVHEVGAVAGSAGIGGAVAGTANSANVRHDDGGQAEIATVQFPCSEASYTAVPRGSLRTPLPRHPDLRPSPTPAAAATLGPMQAAPRPSASLAP
jgi:hypothetical protein